MIATFKTTPSKRGQIILDTLKNVVAATLERKRKLGQYAVTWDGKKPIQQGIDAPDNKD